MTAIVGITDGSTVFIGGDSAGSNSYNLTVRKDTKVFRAGEFVIGFTTSFWGNYLLMGGSLPP
jgi:hypothetical protein